MAASLALSLRLAPSPSPAAAQLSLHRHRGRGRGGGGAGVRFAACRATATFHQLDAVGEFPGPWVGSSRLVLAF
jgi:hypothetical protein